MAMDLMTEEGRAEAERLARQLVDRGATLTVGDGELGSLNDLVDDEDDDDGDEDPADFLVRYDAAVARVLAAQAHFALLKVQAKGAKEEVELALFALQRLRKHAPDTEKDAPRQLALRRIR